MFTQVRVGLWKQSFKIYKFRTMRVDAEKDGAKWASKNDPRVTSAGPGSDRSRSDASIDCLWRARPAWLPALSLAEVS